MKRVFNARLLPIEWTKVSIWMFLNLSVIYLIGVNLKIASVYFLIPLMILLFVLFNKIRSNEIYDWAQYYKFEIDYIKAMDFSHKEISWSRLLRQEYLVGLRNNAGDVGEMYIYFIYKQLFNFFKVWTSKPIKSPIRGIVANEEP